MGAWLDNLMSEIRQEAKRLAEMDGTMEEKKKWKRYLSLE